jgi:hypothetical protein
MYESNAHRRKHQRIWLLAFPLNEKLLPADNTIANSTLHTFHMEVSPFKMELGGISPTQSGFNQ